MLLCTAGQTARSLISDRQNRDRAVAGIIGYGDISRNKVAVDEMSCPQFGDLADAAGNRRLMTLATSLRVVDRPSPLVMKSTS